MADKYIFANERWCNDLVKSMQSKGMSYRKLADKLPMSSSSIFRIASGRNSPTLDEFIIICAVLDLEAITYFDEDQVQYRMF